MSYYCSSPIMHKSIFRNSFILTILLTIIGLSNAISQPLNKRSHWLFGKHAHIDFSNGAPQIKTDNPFDKYTDLVSISDENDQLLFFTDGEKVYNGNFKEVANLDIEGQLRDVIVLPTTKDGVYHIFTISKGDLHHNKYDVSKEALVGKTKILAFNCSSSMTAIQHCYSGKYWLIVPTATDNSINSYYVHDNSISAPVNSKVGQNHDNWFGEITASFQGDKLAISYFSQHTVVLFDFDKKCGQISNPNVLEKDPLWDYPDGLEFSPDGSILYVCYSYKESHLVEYKTENPSIYNLIYQDDNNINDICISPNGKYLYTNRHVNHIPSQRIDRLDNPNNFGNHNYIAENITLLMPSIGGFSFPHFINASDIAPCDNEGRKVQYQWKGSACKGSTIQFLSNYAENHYSNPRWIIEQDGNTTEIAQKNATHFFSDTGKVSVFLVLDFCSFTDTSYFELTIGEALQYTIDGDSTICDGDSILIGAKTDKSYTYLWEDGNTNSQKWVKDGSFSLEIKDGDCAAEEEINISNFPPLWILLGDAFYICEEEDEKVLLDAGKGFRRYKWLPTEDTTQWVIVDKIGDYIVAVEDHQGCKADKGTTVNQRCDFLIHIPNSFSPNGDGINDLFKPFMENIEKASMSIYNQWGEMVYKTTEFPIEWNGNNSSVGVYWYSIEAEGYQKKRLRKVFKQGNIHLLR